VPKAAQPALTRAVGGISGKDHAEQLAQCAVACRPAPGTGAPLVQGCIAHLVGRLLPASAHENGPHGLFLAELIAAWADTRALSEGALAFRASARSLAQPAPCGGLIYYAIGPPLAPRSDPPSAQIQPSSICPNWRGNSRVASMQPPSA
jgi:hypothetical protein